MYKTAVYSLVNGSITHKNSKYMKKEILRSKCRNTFFRRDFDWPRFALVRVSVSVCDQSEPSSRAGSVQFNMPDVFVCKSKNL